MKINCDRGNAIEPIIGYIKNDHRMLRNFLKGELGDKINAILAGAAFNFKKALNEIKAFILFYLQFFLNIINPQKSNHIYFYRTLTF